MTSVEVALEAFEANKKNITGEVLIVNLDNVKYKRSRSKGSEKAQTVSKRELTPRKV